MGYDLRKGLYPYPLSYLASDGGTYNPPFLAGDPQSALSVGNNWYVICVTADQWTMIKSSIQVGAPIAYPDSYNEPIEIIWQANEFPNDIPDNTCMSLCDLIYDCIQSTPELQQLIAGYSNGSAITSTTPENTTILNTDLFGGQGPCDNDNIFGMTLQLTDFLNQTSEDLLEIIVTAFQTPGRLGDMIEAIPGVGVLPFDDILQFAEKMAVQVNDAYQAAYDTQIREDIACALFCLAQDTCSLTLEQARDWFKSQIVAAVDDENFLAIVNDIIANNWLGEQSIYMLGWMILDTIIFGGEILGIDSNRVVTTIATFYNDPNPDWAILCTDCQWTSVLDLTTDDYGFIFDLDQNSVPVGSWVNGVGLIGEAVTIDSQSRTQLSGGWDFDNSQITSWRIEGTFTKGSVPGYAGGYVSVNDRLELDDAVIAGTQQTRTFNDFTVGVQTDIDISASGFEVTANEFYMFYRSALDASNGATTIHTVTITGSGAKPSQLP